MDLEVRPARDDEFEEYCRVESLPFGEFETEEGIAQNRATLDPRRMLVAVDDKAVVATTASYAYELTVPGGATIPAAGVTGVAVLPTHRRRGLLRRLMERQLDDTLAWGEPVAILNASESSIYGRFGYGLASRYQSIEIATAAAALETPPTVEGNFRLIPKAEAAPALVPIYEAYRAVQPGAVSRTDEWWDVMLGDRRSWKGGGPLFVAVFEPADGSIGGYVIYEFKKDGHPGSWKLVVQEQAAVDPGVDAMLWRFCLEVDLIDTVERFFCPLDDPIEWRLSDPRRFHTVGVRDYLWVRMLDIPSALGARSYAADGAVVFEVADAFRPGNAGTYRLSCEGGGGVCERLPTATVATPAIRLDVDALGATYLGGVTFSTLARAGRVTEFELGALARADALFVTDRQPFCPTRF